MISNPLQQALNDRLARLGSNAVINLIDSNFHENGFMLPPEILKEGFERYLRQRHYQPESLGDFAARQAISDWYGKAACPADPAHIVLTASSSESYNLLFQTFTEAGDNILLPTPGYPLFEELCRYNHLEPRFYPLNEAIQWQPDLDIMDSLADEQTRFMVLISPNNPCGSVLGEPEIQAILAMCRRHGLMLICDEVFSEFLYGLDYLPRPATLCRDIPIFTLNGISKLFACPDLKLSWILCSGPQGNAKFPTLGEIIQELETRNDTFLNCNSFTQFLLPELFKTGSAFTTSMTSQLARNRKMLQDILIPALPPGARMVLPQGGIHCLICFSRYQIEDDEALAIRLLERGLYLHPGYLYGLEEQPALVLSLLKKPGSFELGIRRLAEALPSLL